MWPQALCNCRRSSPRSCWRVWSGMSWGVGRRTEVTAGNSHRCARSTATKLEAACRPTLTATMRACWPGHVVARVRLTERVVGRYTLGHVAGTLVHCGVTGYLASVRCLKRPTSQWAVGAAPLSAMAVVERQIDGTLDAVIQPTIVRPRHGCSPLLVPSACAYLYALHVPPRWTWRTSHSARLRLSGHSS